jgi:hypothetical protein
LVGLLRLFEARTVNVTVTSPHTGTVLTADIDRGYWRLFADSRYAGYSGTETPVVCAKSATARNDVRVAAEQVPIVAGVGWDFSHARRLVHALDAIDRNRSALGPVFGVPPTILPAQDLPKQFAAQLVTTIWNGDKDRPIFANYWNGTNGWYRVAYNNGARACFKGYPPFGLSDSFATGGFIIWQRHFPIIGRLGARIYELSQLADGDSSAFIKSYYPELGRDASPNNRALTQLMFWPTLVSEDKQN